MTRDLSHERLTSLLSYEEETGIFRWLTYRSQRARVGDRAGYAHSDGYWCIQIDGRTYLASRLAWFYVTGNWPLNQMDHKDGNNCNDKFSNLREATPIQNCGNRKKRKDSSNLYKGIHKKGNLYRATIQVNGKRKSLGYFCTADLAAEAYRMAAISVFGEFAKW